MNVPKLTYRTNCNKIDTGIFDSGGGIFENDKICQNVVRLYNLKKKGGTLFGEGKCSFSIFS